MRYLVLALGMVAVSAFSQEISAPQILKWQAEAQAREAALARRLDPEGRNAQPGPPAAQQDQSNPKTEVAAR